MDERDLPELAANGLVVATVEKVERESKVPLTMNPLATPEFASLGMSSVRKPGAARRATAGAPVPKEPRRGRREVPIAARGKAPADKVVSRDPSRAQFYIVRLHGPLTEARREELGSIGIKLNERLSSCKYTVRLKAAEVDELAALTFVDWIRLYTAEDTLRDAPGRRPRRDDPGTQRTSIYAVTVHRSQDIGQVVAWLIERKREPLSVDGDVLRVGCRNAGAR